MVSYTSYRRKQVVHSHFGVHQTDAVLVFVKSERCDGGEENLFGRFREVFKKGDTVAEFGRIRFG